MVLFLIHLDKSRFEKFAKLKHAETVPEAASPSRWRPRIEKQHSVPSLLHSNVTVTEYDTVDAPSRKDTGCPLWSISASAKVTMSDSDCPIAFLDQPSYGKT